MARALQRDNDAPLLASMDAGNPVAPDGAPLFLAPMRARRIDPGPVGAGKNMTMSLAAVERRLGIEGGE